MSEQDYAEIRAMLLNEKEQIIGELEAQNERIKHITEEHEIGDTIDDSVEERDREFTYLFHDRVRHKLELIEDAIDRIDDQDYGHCEECDELISIRRLKALPFTRYCVQCQEEEERHSGRRNSYRPLTRAAGNE